MKVKTLAKKINPTLRENGVVRAGLFGSHATGKSRKTSDIDILVKFKGTKSLLDLASLELELERKLHKKVDLLTYESLSPLLRDRILTEEQRIL